jgi:hypothetical protein
MTIATPGADSPMLLFLHIPKAAGSTLNKIIERQYPARSIYKIDTEEPQRSMDEFKALPPTAKAQLKVLLGHMPFGFHQYFTQPTTYITILRDPVDRIVSMYFYILRHKKHYLHKELTSRNISLEEFVSEGYSPETENGMVKAISANFTPWGGATRADLETALANVEKHFSVVGISERFDETLWLMKKRFGWRFPYYLKENVTPERPAKERISPEALQTIQKNNLLDQELYDYAQQRLTREVQQHGPGFHDEIARFLRLSHPVATVHQAARAVRFALCPWRKQR